MAVEEEGLRVFQSVKIKIGKKKIPYPQSERLNGYDSILTGQIGTEGWRLEGTDLICLVPAVIVIQITLFLCRAQTVKTNCKIENLEGKHERYKAL